MPCTASRWYACPLIQRLATTFSEIFRLLTRPAPIDDYGDLRPARQAKNITLATRRHSFGVPLMTVSRLERGHQRNDTLANNYRQWLTAA